MEAVAGGWLAGWTDEQVKDLEWDRELRECGARNCLGSGLLEVLCENQHENRQREADCVVLHTFFSVGSHEESLF